MDIVKSSHLYFSSALYDTDCQSSFIEINKQKQKNGNSAIAQILL